MTPTNDPTPTADALEAWLAEVERVAMLMSYPGTEELEDLDPPPWATEVHDND